MRQPLIYAHRGASAYAPENTIAAFKKAISMGADGLELDVHISLDGRLVIIHDETVDRTSNGKGFVKDKTLEELRSLDFGSWFSSDYRSERIPELAEVLELYNSWPGLLNIEIKNGPVFYPGIESKVADVVRSSGMLKRTVISSFNHYSLVEIKRIEPAIKTAPLYMEGLYEPWAYARRVGAHAIHPFFYNIVPEIMKGCRENGIEVSPFTVDQPHHLEKMILAGVDGIITNVPDVARNLIRRQGG